MNRTEPDARMVREALLSWYDENRRELPWRGTRDPYQIWVSETMLQQTRVETVKRYYTRFLEVFPDAAALAAATREQVLKAWEGMGYYRRAVLLHEGAQQLMHAMQGQFPRTRDALLQIRGIGEYTAAAIASIAFQEPVAAMDGNAFRVYARILGEERAVEQADTRRTLTEWGNACALGPRPGDLNQAVMDLGNGPCRAGVPLCDTCPLRKICAAHQRGTQDTIPRHRKKTPPKEISYALALLLGSENDIGMVKRQEQLLKDLWVFPLLENVKGEICVTSALMEKGIQVTGKVTELGSYRHVFTHRIWKMTVYGVSSFSGTMEGLQMIPLEAIHGQPIPSAMRGALEQMEIWLSGNADRKE